MKTLSVLLFGCGLLILFDAGRAAAADNPAANWSPAGGTWVAERHVADLNLDLTYRATLSADGTYKIVVSGDNFVKTFRGKYTYEYQGENVGVLKMTDSDDHTEETGTVEWIDKDHVKYTGGGVKIEYRR